MKNKTLEILEKVSKNELTLNEAQEQLFVLFGVMSSVEEKTEQNDKIDCSKATFPTIRRAVHSSNITL